MSQVEKIEQEIMKLSPSQLAKFRVWYDAFDADRWDREIESHTNAGKLDTLINEAQACYQRDETKEI